MRYVFIAGMIYSLILCVHFLWEAWLIAKKFGKAALGEIPPDSELIPECRAWWCPHGLLNRWKTRD
jgi:hypothetical protein